MVKLILQELSALHLCVCQHFTQTPAPSAKVRIIFNFSVLVFLMT